MGSTKLSENTTPMALPRPVRDLRHRGDAATALASSTASIADAQQEEEWEGGGGVGDEEHLTLAQNAALLSLRNSLQESGALLLQPATDADLLRFLKARAYDVAKARTMYEAMLKWRKEIGADTIQETFQFPERKAVKELYPHFHHKTDKRGRPIYIERYGQVQLENLLKLTTFDRLLLYHIKEWEILINCKFPACSKAAHKPISQSLTILDLKGVTMKHLSNQVRQFLHKITQIDQDYYPEFLGHMVIINAPTTFKAMWQLVKPWLDKNTQKKIEVHGSSFTCKLLDLVDSENLPEFLGGTCHCAGGCEHSDAGPWKQYSYQPWPEDS